MQRLSEVINANFSIRSAKDNMPILARQREVGGRMSLANMMRDMGVQRGVEIGTRKGHSAELWCKTIPGLELVCIDPYMAYHILHKSQSEQNAIYEEAVKRLEPYNVTIIRKKSQDAVDEIEDASADFLNIDGSHVFDVVVMDIVQYVPKVREGGLVMIHDYCSFCLSGVIEAVNAYTHCHDIRPWYVTREYNPTAFWERGAEQV